MTKELKAKIIDDDTVELRCGDSYTIRKKDGYVDYECGCDWKEIPKFLSKYDPNPDLYEGTVDDIISRNRVIWERQYNSIRELALEQAKTADPHKLLKAYTHFTEDWPQDMRKEFFNIIREVYFDIIERHAKEQNGNCSGCGMKLKTIETECHIKCKYCNKVIEYKIGGCDFVDEDPTQPSWKVLIPGKLARVKCGEFELYACPDGELMDYAADYGVNKGWYGGLDYVAYDRFPKNWPKGIGVFWENTTLFEMYHEIERRAKEQKGNCSECGRKTNWNNIIVRYWDEEEHCDECFRTKCEIIKESREKGSKKTQDEKIYEYTGSGKIKLSDCRVIEIPPPPDGEGWEIDEDAIRNNDDDVWITYDPTHHEGLLIWREFFRIGYTTITWTNYRREIKPAPPAEYYETYCEPDSCISETGDREATVRSWPRRRPSGAVREEK